MDKIDDVIQQWMPDQEAARRWGGDGRMSELDALLWRTERHPVSSSTTMILETLDRTPDWDRLCHAHEWAVDFVPLLRQRVVEPLVPVAPPVWSTDATFELSHHLRRTSLPAPGTHDQLLQLAQAIALTPFDRTRPLWEATLVDGYDGRAAYVLKIHHAMTDGLGAFQLLRLVHSPQREHTLLKPRDRPPGRRTALQATGHGLARQVAHLPSALQTLTVASTRILADPAGSASRTVRLLRSAGRSINPPGSGSPLIQQATRSAWTFSTLECPFGDLRAAAKAAQGSVNDAFLAVVVGGIARYHRTQNAPIDRLSVFMPVSVRKPGEDEAGNRMVAARVTLPARVDEPAARVAAIRDIVRAAREEPALEAINAAAPFVNRLPGAIATLAMAKLGVGADIAASNVPGLQHDSYLAGAKIERLYGFGPLPGTALLATLNSHVGTACIGINSDATAFQDRTRLHQCLQASLDEVLGLGDRTPETDRSASG